MRDRGIDLIVFTDKKFKAIPVQLKSSSGRRFSVNEKYKEFPDMLHAFVCYATEPMKAELYIMNYEQTIKVANDMGWNWSRAWSAPYFSPKLTKLLDSYHYRPGMLAELVQTHT